MRSRWRWGVVVLAGAMIALGVCGAAEQANPKAANLQLTSEERAWLAANPRIRVSGDPAWPPFSMYEKKKGQYEGSDFAILRVLAAKLGLQLIEVRVADWNEAYQKVLSNEVDVVTSTTPSAEREQALVFTSSYFSLPVAIVARQDAPFQVDLSRLAPGIRLAGPRGYITTEQILRYHPHNPLILTSTSRESLEAVSRGEADLALENVGVASHYIRAHRLSNLKIAGFVSSRFDLAFGVRRELPLLASALDKALDSMSAEERGDIAGAWLADDYTPGLKLRGVLTAGGFLLGIAAAVVLVMAWHNRRLATEIAQRIACEEELREANDRLRTLNDEKTMFMKMAAHDLKNPLSVILGTTELLLMHQLTRSLDQRTASLMGDIQDNAYRMLRLIRNLLDADAIERGQTNLRPTEVVLGRVVEHALERFRHGANRKQVKLLLEEEKEGGERIKVWADEDALSRVLDNLISNALKFTRSGTTVTLRVRNLNDRSTDPCARLEVCDQGPGLSVDDKEKVFQPHAKLSARPTDGEESHGLGLSIVRRLCAGIGGSVFYEDGPLGGACFIVELPVVSEAPITTHANT